VDLLEEEDYHPGYCCSDRFAAGCSAAYQFIVVEGNYFPVEVRPWVC
jgi:hypothetical protein